MCPATIFHELLVELRGAGGWRNPVCCWWHGGQLVVEPVPTGDAPLPLHYRPNPQWSPERRGEAGGCRLVVRVGWGGMHPTYVGYRLKRIVATDWWAINISRELTKNRGYPRICSKIQKALRYWDRSLGGARSQKRKSKSLTGMSLS